MFIVVLGEMFSIEPTTSDHFLKRGPMFRCLLEENKVEIF